jgi:hypothetical protein
MRPWRGKQGEMALLTDRKGNLRTIKTPVTKRPKSRRILLMGNIKIAVEYVWTFSEWLLEDSFFWDMMPCYWIIGSRRFEKKVASSSSCI